MQYVYLILAFLCGAIYPIQGSLNGKLLNNVGNPIITAIISFLAGLIGLVVLGIVNRIPWSQFSAIKTTPWYTLTGGLLGAFYVATAVIILPRLGMVLTFSLIIAGQITLSIIIDHFGLLGNPVRLISFGKIAGVLLLGIAVFLIRKY
jgi:bacterial/archaeal transporter family-2 protein